MVESGTVAHSCKASSWDGCEFEVRLGLHIGSPSKAKGRREGKARALHLASIFLFLEFSQTSRIFITDICRGKIIVFKCLKFGIKSIHVISKFR